VSIYEYKQQVIEPSRFFTTAHSQSMMYTTSKGDRMVMVEVDAEHHIHMSLDELEAITRHFRGLGKDE
jgi:hypothetical protein